MRPARTIAAAVAVLLLGAAIACSDSLGPGGNPVGTYALAQVNGKGPPFRLAYDSGQAGVQSIYAVLDTIYILADRSAHRTEHYSNSDPTAADSVPFWGASYPGFYFVDGARLVIRWRVPGSSPFDPGTIVFDTLTIDGSRLRRSGMYRSPYLRSYPAEWIYSRQ